ncbi:S23 ribosomal protein [Croceitalea dokdonensis DOKDO 023]|uniref:S23 ribosomal protein n=1 Tax=Croceitalea dokdonensis DOKDO 023 TaxID=1300341 RepID=A0A0P7AWQ8_9FLAO|nr:four helix bundle protein [Croceitalea dokdonensis]KPM33160.1 S23 ribosomal protein [Croceitalea dokdonensis DOKDO 023]
MRRHNFKKLKIWQDGMDLVDDTYALIIDFPREEKFNLSSQLARCAVSIPSNIAEGTSKSTDKHFNKYLEDSLGSSFEWETQLIVAFRQGFISKQRYDALETKIQQLQKMISGFQGRLTL